MKNITADYSVELQFYAAIAHQTNRFSEDRAIYNHYLIKRDGRHDAVSGIRMLLHFKSIGLVGK